MAIDTLPPYAIYHTVSISYGPEGARLTEEIDSMIVRLNESISLRGNNTAALAALDAMRLEASVANWDQDGSAAMDEVAYSKAANFISLMPAAWPIPHVDVQRDGGVLFEWIVAPTKRISVSFKDLPRISFAWLIGSESSYGVDDFACRIPVGFAVQAKRVFGA